MDKVKLEFKTPEKKTVEYNGVSIEITPFLGVAEQIGLINRYVEQYFNKAENSLVVGSDYDYLNAEYSFMNYILQTCTNIDIESLPEDIFADDSFWNKIVSQISNYSDFRNKLGYIVNEIKQQEVVRNSLGKVLSDLVAKAYTMMDGLAEITPEQLETATSSAMSLMDELKKTSIIEAEKKPVAKRKPKNDNGKA